MPRRLVPYSDSELEEEIDSTQPQPLAKLRTHSKDCVTKCKFSCALKFSFSEKLQLHDDFKNEIQYNAKDFIKSYTTRSATRASKKEDFTPRKKYTYKYFLPIESQRTRVCKAYFLNTLNISQKSVYRFYDNN